MVGKRVPWMLKCAAPCAAALWLAVTVGRTQETAGTPDIGPGTAMLTPWGVREYTDGDYCRHEWPAWAVAAFKLGGTWDFDGPGWTVAGGNLGALCLEVDRSALEQDLAMAVWFAGSAPVVDLYDAEGVVVAEDLGGIPVGAGPGLSGAIYALALSAHPTAVGILLRNTGELKVRSTLLFECPDAIAVHGIGDTDGSSCVRAVGSGAAVDEVPPAPMCGEMSPAGGPLPAASGAASVSASGEFEAGRGRPARGSARVTVGAPASGSRILW